MQDFRKLMVWQKSHALVLETYRVTADFPQAELYGLTSQIRRASASIPANIAEGCGRSGNAELGRFLQIAMGSASELHYHFILAHDLGYLTEAHYQSVEGHTIEVKQMLSSLLQKTRST
jgi:four helix bundle protein